MKLPSAQEALFSVKTFAASMLALYLAMRIGLARPFWAMTTVYIVSNPLAGAIRSKALYRIAGTVIGSVATVLLVPSLVNSPELLSLTLALWVGLCLFVSLLDRTPRSYVFMLAGYTAALIGFPAVNAPESIFDTALARVEEITLGITCATLIHVLFFPRSFASTLLPRLDGAIDDARRCVADVLTDKAGDHAQRDRRKLAGDITELRLMATHLPFDTSNLRWTYSAILALQDRLSVIVPLLSGIEDRLHELRRLDGERLLAPWRALRDDVAAWVSGGVQASPERAAELRVAIDGMRPTIRRDAAWGELLQVNLAARLRSLVDACEDCRTLQQHVSAGVHDSAAATAGRFTGLTPRVLHRDYRLALMSAFAAVIAIAACCAFWILSAWPAGSAAPMIAAVLCCLFASQDDPVSSIKPFMNATLWSIPLAALYLLILLPAAHSFESLVLVTAPLFVVLGIYIARPTTVRTVMPILFGVTGALALQDTGTADLISFTNSMLAQLTGIGAALLFTRLLRSVSVEWTARRLLRAGWRELAAMGNAQQVPSVATMSARMLDRIGLLTPRLAAADPQGDLAAVDTLSDLRIGLNMTQLVRVQSQLEPTVFLQPLIASLSAHFRERMKYPDAANPALLERIDATLRDVCAVDGRPGQSEAVAALVGVRRDLFPAAPAYQAAPRLVEEAQ